LARPAPHVLLSSFVGPSSFSQQPCPDYHDIREALRSIQEEHASVWAFVASEHSPLRNFVQEQRDELRGLIASQNQYFQDFSACLQTWHDWHLSQPHPPSSLPPPPPFLGLLFLQPPR